MNNTPAQRTQVDGLQDFYSDLAAIRFDSGEQRDRDTARQEFKDDADVNVILRKFGVNAQQRPVVFGEVDFDLDLQRALGAIEQARAAHAAMPETLRAKYPTWQSMLNGLDSGAFRIDLDQEGNRPKTVTPPAPSEAGVT